MERIHFLQEKIEHAFANLRFPESPKELFLPMSYTLDSGGKRIRPLLVLLGCDLFNGNLDEAIHPAIGIELFHNFTLLHDDIMDNAPLRRGKETVYKKWDANTAILSGDGLFALANLYLLKTNQTLVGEILELYSQTGLEVCEGQQYDMNFESCDQVSIGEYMEMIRLKTAVLLACSLKIGAIIAKAPSADANALYNFGLNLGLAFQLQDDWLDIFSKEEKFGKTCGGDILSCKKTFLYLKSLELLGENAAPFQKLYNDTTLENSQKIAEVKKIYSQLNIDEIALHESDIFYTTALDFFAQINKTETEKSALLLVVRNLMKREN